MAYKSFAAGYLVKDNKVFLVHNKKYNKWVPPGGHIEENETPDQTAIRELREEVGLDVEIIPGHESAPVGVANAIPVPLPFHIDLEHEGFDIPHIGYFFYIKLKDPAQTAKILENELHNMGWFGKEDLATLPTFDQVRVLASYAIDHYPKE